MNACYKKGIVDGAFAALPCIIPVVNIIMIFVYIKMLRDDWMCSFKWYAWNAT